MPEFLGMDKRKWMWVGLAVAGVVGLYLMTHRSGAPAASGDAGLPVTGPPPFGNQTPAAGGFFDQGEQAAAFQSTRDRFLAMRQFQAAQEIPTTGIVQGAWEQLASGDWIGIKSDNRGRLLSDTEAHRIGGKNKGPYAEGGGGFFGRYVLPILSAVAGNVAGAYTAGQPITAGSAFLGPTTVQSSPYSGRTPPIAPATRYGNNAAPPQGWRVPEVF